MGKSGLDQPAFCPTIHLQLPCIPSSKQWLKLWPTQEILSSELVLAPQFFPIVDLQPLSATSRSTVVIESLPVSGQLSNQRPLLPSRMISDLRDLSPRNSPLNQRLSLIPFFRPSGVLTLKLSLPHMEIFQSGRSVATCLPEPMARIPS
jgi:hypothetical protein